MSDDDYTGPVPIVPHLHGGENESNSDGYPTAWFTPDFKIKGKDWHQDTYTYYNTQPAATLWFHDHALGITRLNVYAGLAGFYILRDKNDNIEKKLPQGQYEIPILIQDRMFYDDGSLAFPDDGVNPDKHPFWEPEFFGNCILVNGVIWPHLDVEPRKYRFRLLNGSNARFYHLKFSNNMTFYQIGTDGGYLPETAGMKELLLAPSERADLIVDFSNLPMGTNIILTNDAAAPFPGGDPVDSATTAQIMQFRVNKPLQGSDSTVVPTTLRTINKPTKIDKTRIITLNEMPGENGPLGAVIDGKMWDYMTTETPVMGTTELWKIVNLTEDAHPIHVHLVQFWLQSRQEFDKDEYQKEYDEENTEIPVPMDKDYHTVDVEKYLEGEARGPEPNETGLKDVYVVYPGEVTTFLIKFAPLDRDSFAFDPTEGPGYVFHCHILDHKDNEMMRPYNVLPKTSTVVAEDQPSGSDLIFTHYPNPVKNSALVSYTIPEPERVTITISDMLGNKLSTLIDEVQSAGDHQAGFDAASLSEGVYLYKIKAGNVIKTSRFVVLK
jgi:FtsP/CotA-like multicopper oxidase with cupredoxin domain